MGRYVRKREAPGEVADMTEGRKRKTVLGESEISTSAVQLKTRRLAVTPPANSASPASSGNSPTSSGYCESVSSGNVLASCCSSSRTSEVAKESLRFADLEENAVNVECFSALAGHSVDFRDRREKTPPSEVQAAPGELESTARPRDSNSLRFSAAEKMPTEAELEEFFVAAEKKLHKQFVDKYNYDIVKDEPLEGRYEWVPVKLKP